MGVFGYISTFDREVRLLRLLKEPLLVQVLEHLPHLQATTTKQEQTWETVLTNLKAYWYTKAYKSASPQENQDVEHLSVPLIKKLFASAQARSLFRSFIDPLRDCACRSDFLLYEIHKLEALSASQMAAKSWQKFKKNDEDFGTRHGDSVDIFGDENAYEDASTSQDATLDSHRKELVKMSSKIASLEEENRKLLESNHQLSSGKYHD